MFQESNVWIGSGWGVLTEFLSECVTGDWAGASNTVKHIIGLVAFLSS